MGFLDKLQDVGFGNRGPYGRQMSGATYFSNTVQDRLGQETFKGVESAITQAAGAGPITFDKQVEISEKWGVPLRDITARSVDVNKMYEQKRQAQFLHTFWGMFQKKKQMEPEWKPDEEWIRNAIRESKGTGPEDFALAVGAMKKVRGQQRMINMKAGDTLTDVSTAIDGKIKATPVFTAKEKGKKPDDKWEDSIEYYGGNQIRISRNKTTGEVRHKVIDAATTEKHDKTKIKMRKGGAQVEIPQYLVKQYKKQGWTEGWIKDDPLGGKPTDFERSYKQKISDPKFKALTRDEFRTKYWTKEGGDLSDNAVYERIQDYAFTIDPELYPLMTGEYEKYRKAGLGRNDALNRVTNTNYRMSSNKIFKEVQPGQWMRIK